MWEGKHGSETLTHPSPFPEQKGAVASHPAQSISIPSRHAQTAGAAFAAGTRSPLQEGAQSLGVPVPLISWEPANTRMLVEKLVGACADVEGFRGARNWQAGVRGTGENKPLPSPAEQTHHTMGHSAMFYGSPFCQAEENATAALARCCSPHGDLRTGANGERVFPAGQRVGEQVLSLGWSEQDPPGCTKRNAPSWGERESSGRVSCTEHYKKSVQGV